MVQLGTLTEGTFPLAGGGCYQVAERRYGGGPHWLDEDGLVPEGNAWSPGGGGSGSGAAAQWLVGVGGEALCRAMAAVPFLRLQKTQRVQLKYFLLKCKQKFHPFMVSASSTCELKLGIEGIVIYLPEASSSVMFGELSGVYRVFAMQVWKQ